MARGPLDVLPFDICDRILTCLPDFYSLQFAVLSSRYLYESYLPRKRSILRAVAENDVGPALPFAICLARTMRKLDEEPMQKILEGLNDTDMDSPYWTTDVASAEARRLSHVAAVLRRLESFFCVLYKDRSATVSTLSETERFRFRRAIYRIWILSVLANDKHELSKWEGCKLTFLESMSERESVEMFEGVRFLNRIFVSKMQSQGISADIFRPFELQMDDLLAICDDGVVAQYPSNLRSASGDALVSAYSILEGEMQSRSLFEGKYDSTCILEESRVEGIQTCQKCYVPNPWLYGENNWHLLGSILDHRRLLSCLPGKLALNHRIDYDLRCVLKKCSSYVLMMDEMFSSQNDPGSGWAKSDWLCVPCIVDFLKERLFSWFVNELVKDGHQFKENCWYGWNCRTQCHRPQHAQKLNHLCEPTDRDDTNKTNTIVVPPVGEVETGSDSEWESDDQDGDL